MVSVTKFLIILPSPNRLGFEKQNKLEVTKESYPKRNKANVGKREGNLDRLRQTHPNGDGHDRRERLVHVRSESCGPGKGISAADGNREED